MPSSKLPISDSSDVLPVVAQVPATGRKRYVKPSLVLLRQSDTQAKRTAQPTESTSALYGVYAGTPS